MISKHTHTANADTHTHTTHTLFWILNRNNNAILSTCWNIRTNPLDSCYIKSLLQFCFVNFVYTEKALKVITHLVSGTRIAWLNLNSLKFGDIFPYNYWHYSYHYDINNLKSNKIKVQGIGWTGEINTWHLCD